MATLAGVGADRSLVSEDGVTPYEPWVRLALASPPWPNEKRQRAERLRESALHLGEVAEMLNCSVFEVQAELGIGRSRDVRAYRRIRGLDVARGSLVVCAVV